MIFFVILHLSKEKRHITFFRFFFLLVFVVHLGSITQFNHTHVLNGVIIVHSHINTGEHTHSKQSFETIFFLSNILASGDFQSSFIPVLWIFLIRVLLVPVLSDIITISRGVLSLRAPPASFWCYNMNFPHRLTGKEFLCIFQIKTTV